MKVSLEDWLNDKLIGKHRPSAREIANLLHICDRDLEKVQIIELGPDWRLSIAHNAALQAATAALAAVGYPAMQEDQATYTERVREKSAAASIPAQRASEKAGGKN